MQALAVAWFILPACMASDIDLQESTDLSFPAHLNPAEWELVWQDEFSGKALDETKWKHCPEWDRQDGACQWSDKDAWVDGGGHLLVRLRKHDGRIYSGAVRTMGLFEKQYGYFEIRCKVPKIQGGWCAFWMMPVPSNRPPEKGGHDGTEIDIFESIDGNKGHVNHALHWDGYGKDLKSQVHRIEGRHDLYEGDHSFGLMWSEEEYVFYIDDKETWRTAAGGVMRVPAYLKMTMEAADWAGDIHAEELPKTMTVDYVRVYERK